MQIIRCRFLRLSPLRSSVVLGVHQCKRKTHTPAKECGCPETLPSPVQIVTSILIGPLHDICTRENTLGLHLDTFA